MKSRECQLALLLALLFVVVAPRPSLAQQLTEEQVDPGDEEVPALDQEAAPSPEGGIQVPKEEQPVVSVPEAPSPEEEEAQATPKYGDKPFSFQLGGVTFTPFLQARFRQETRLDPYGPAAETFDSIHFLTTRVRFGLTAQWKFIRAMMQIQDVRFFGSFPGIDDGSAFALHQGILEIGDERGYIRVGRQEINYGNQRMIGALDWLMSARSFDAIRLHGFFGDKIELDLFGAMLARQQVIVDESVDPPETFTNNGSYLATTNLSVRHSEGLYLEAYVLYRHDRPRSVGTLGLENDIASPGIYLTGVPLQGLKYTGEFTIQGGRSANNTFFAFAVSGDLDYTFEKPSWKPTLNGGFAYATGASSNGKVDEFNNFFPTNHKFYGAADLIGLRNLIEGHAHFSIKAPKRPVGARLGIYNFALANPSARWSNVAGVTFGLNPENTVRNLGQEVDLLFKWSFLPGISLSGGWTVFVPNQGSRNLGNNDVQQWGYLMLGAQTP